MQYEMGKLKFGFKACLESGSSCGRLSRSPNYFVKFPFKDFRLRKVGLCSMCKISLKMAYFWKISSKERFLRCYENVIPVKKEEKKDAQGYIRQNMFKD